MLRVAPVYTAPLANCGTLVCYTQRHREPRPTRASFASTRPIGWRARSTSAPGSNAAASPPSPTATSRRCCGTARPIEIWVRRFDAAGVMGWSTELTNSDNHPTDFGIGESRLEFGGGKYGAYYHVHSDSGHEGDTLKFTDAASGAQTTTWSWGCSHSMSDLLTYHPTSNAFLPSCVTDCYPGTSGGNFATDSIGGVYTENRNRVMDVAAGCNGSVAGELGGAAVAPSGWKLVCNAHQGAVTMGQSSYSTSTMNQDIAFAEHRHQQDPVGRRRLADDHRRRQRGRLRDRALAARRRRHRAVRRRLAASRRAVYKLARVGATGNVHRRAHRRRGEGALGPARRSVPRPRQPRRRVGVVRRRRRDHAARRPPALRRQRAVRGVLVAFHNPVLVLVLVLVAVLVAASAPVRRRRDEDDHEDDHEDGRGFVRAF